MFYINKHAKYYHHIWGDILQLFEKNLRAGARIRFQDGDCGLFPTDRDGTASKKNIEKMLHNLNEHGNERTYERKYEQEKLKTKLITSTFDEIYENCPWKCTVNSNHTWCSAVGVHYDCTKENCAFAYWLKKMEILRR